ncbi:MAG TPA: ABC transporter ATP-binding protein [Candidatus Binatia bacterium]
MSEIAVRAEKLGKTYRIGRQEKYHALRDVLARPLAALGSRWREKLSRGGGNEKTSSTYRGAGPDHIWALKNLSFEIEQGAVVGVIGRNGAGKTTLLKILSRITEPSEGFAEVRGRIGSLLEVGTGFHPELTGRENIYLNGAILGMKKNEIRQRFDEIVSFAEVEPFIDTVVKHYSSGMHTRLAFAVAAHLEPEILLVDEVLAVGDAAFQKKCLGRMSQVSQEGRTVLFVSHNMSAVHQLCQSVIVLEKGAVLCRESTQEGIRKYLQHVSGENHDSAPSCMSFPEDPSRPIQLRHVALMDGRGNFNNRIQYQEPFSIRIQIDLRRVSREYYTQVVVMDALGNWVLFTADEDLREPDISKVGAGRYGYHVEIPGKILKPGPYSVTVAVNERPGGRVDAAVLSFEIQDHESRRAMRGLYRKYAIVAPEVQWSFENRNSD